MKNIKVLATIMIAVLLTSCAAHQEVKFEQEMARFLELQAAFDAEHMKRWDSPDEKRKRDERDTWRDTLTPQQLEHLHRVCGELWGTARYFYCW